MVAMTAEVVSLRRAMTSYMATAHATAMERRDRDALLGGAVRNRNNFMCASVHHARTARLCDRRLSCGGEQLSPAVACYG